MAPFQTQEFGPYLLVDQIAVGGMAEIYLAKTRGLAGFEKFLALKLIHPDYANDDQFIEMLIDEAKIAVSLNHVNIAQVFDLGHCENRYFISMEYVDGADLFKVMRWLTESDIEVPIDVAAFIVQEVCTGLDYAHRKRDLAGAPLRIIHRDISPQNILVSVAGEVKIVDFGIAKATTRRLETQAGVIKGKYFYMSPEQAWGDPVDHRTDIFSAGIILYEVLTGQMLYLEEDMQLLLDLVRKAEIPSPRERRPEIPPDLERVVMRALAKRPEDRWQSARDFQVALTNFLFSYASDFTPARLAEVVQTAIEAGRRSPVIPDRQTNRVDVELLMSRPDFQPDEEHSMILRISDLKAEEDRGEATVVSGPPEMMGMHRLTRSVRHDPDTEEHWAPMEAEATIVSPNPHAEELSQPETDPGISVLDRRRQELARKPLPRQPLPPPQREAPPPQREAPPLPRQTPPPAVGRAASLHHSPAPTHAAPPLPGANVGEVSEVEPATPAPQTRGHESPTHAPPPAAPAAQTPPPTAQTPPPAGWPQTSPPPGWAQTPPPAGWPQTPAPAGWPQTPAPAGWPQPPSADGQPWPQTPSADGQPWPQPPGAAAAAWPAGQNPWTMTLEKRPAERLRSARRAWAIAAAVMVLLVLSGVTIGFLAYSPLGAQQAEIEVVSAPQGATVTIDGKRLSQQTPLVIPVPDPRRTYKLEVSLPNYLVWSNEVTIPEGQRQVRALAVLTPNFGRLEVHSKPRGADVYINNEHRGRTPTTVDGLTLREPVTLELRMRGYRPVTRTLEWNGQSFLSQRITMRRSR